VLVDFYVVVVVVVVEA